MRAVRPAIAVLALVLIGASLAACSGSGETVREPEAEPEAPTLSDVETFDARPYSLEAPEEPPPPTVRHRVPDVLLRGGADDESDSTKVPLRRSGYRVQIFSSEEKQRAEDVMSQAIAWWQDLYARVDSVRDVFPRDLPVYLEYGAPYYRVRVGDFLQRGPAEEALPVIRERFADAWVVPDQVLVYR